MLIKLILERFDTKGKLLERREQQSKSWTIAFIQMLYVAHAQTTHSMDDITGTARVVTGSSGNHKGPLKIGSPPGKSGTICLCGGGGFAWDNSQQGKDIGIVVGTGATAVTPTDNVLDTRIDHGEGGGQLQHGGTELYGLTIADPNGQFTARRYFTNVSGGAITVNEAGLHSIGVISEAASGEKVCAFPFLIARDVVAPGVSVLNNEILRVTYVPQITV